MASSFRRFVGRVAVGALAVAVPVVLTPVAASAAAPTDLFFSEYVEGSSNNKALEVYNGTGAPVDLAAGGYNVLLSFNGGTSTGTINLTGSVASGDVHVLAAASANAAILAAADQTTTQSLYNGDDAVLLRKGTTVLDVIGQVGTDPGTEWGSDLTSTADNTLRRHADVCTGDTDGSNAFDPSAEWDGFAVDTSDGLGAHTSTCSTEPPADEAPTVASTTPANGATAPAGVSPTITFSEPVTLGGAAITLQCSLSGSVAFSVTGGPTTFTIDPAEDLASGDTCSIIVTASRVSDVDTNDPPDTMDEEASSTFTVTDSCAGAYTPIPQLQGSGDTAALTGTRTTRGVVVGDYEGPSPALRGFYLQDPAGDGDPATSDGIFVFNGGNQDLVELGDLVMVTGNVGENQGQTQVSVTAANVVHCGTGTVAPTDVTLPMATATAFERYEGMLVRMAQTLTVTEHFQLGRFGEVLLSSGGRLQQPTNVVEPGAPAIAMQAQNDLNQILVDDATQAQNPDPIVFGRGGQPLSAENTLRGGDTTTNPVGVMTFTWGGATASPNAYRVRPLNALGGSIEFTAANPRPTHPADVGGDVRAVGMNLLNYFNTFDGLPDNQDTCRLGTQGALTDCRGADTQAEFDRQWPKTVAAILAMDPDVIGVNEIENDGYGPDSALAHLVGKLNAATAPGTYAYVDADAATGQVDALGTDAIKVGQIYKPAKVTRVGKTAVLNSVEFVNGGDSAPRSRPSLAQAYKVNATGGVFVADINHLKSKGSACDADPVGGTVGSGDGQGNCAEVREEAAKALATWLASDPTGTGDQDVLLLGDYNSYSKEKSIVALEAGGYTNLIADRVGADAYSYVFDGQWGYLDYAFGSQSIRSQVTGVAEYHINADEPSVLDYNTNFKSASQLESLYAPDQYRVSDHDPVVVGLSPNSPATVTAAFADGSVSCGTGNASLTVGISDRDAADTHTATIAWGDGSSETVDPASASFTRTHTYAAAGRYTATVTVTDSHGHVTTTTAHVAVEYTTTGLLSPFKEGDTVKAGSTVPVKVGITDCDGSVPTDLAPTVTVSLGGTPVLTGSMVFVTDKWQYDLKTSLLPNPAGTYTVTVTVPDTGQTVTGTLRLRR